MPFVGICDRPHPGLNVSLAEWDVLEPPWEPLSPDSSPGVAAWEARPEGDELLDHLRLSILPWDEHIRILSPKLMLGAGSVGAGRPRKADLSDL